MDYSFLFKNKKLQEAVLSEEELQALKECVLSEEELDEASLSPSQVVQVSNGLHNVLMKLKLTLAQEGTAQELETIDATGELSARFKKWFGRQALQQLEPYVGNQLQIAAIVRQFTNELPKRANDLKTLLTKKSMSKKMTVGDVLPEPEEEVKTDLANKVVYGFKLNKYIVDLLGSFKETDNIKQEFPEIVLN